MKKMSLRDVAILLLQDLFAILNKPYTEKSQGIDPDVTNRKY